ncbi:MAG: hypothetical protein LBC08_04505 [Campylobacteraceae bacterium]|jgi:hypothetical protein|nr:hypothetical protein [Campylobacteraceae bacterium]
MSLIRLFVAVSIAFSTLLAASENPSPLGLEIGVATVKDAKAKLALELDGINPASGGEQYSVTDIKAVNLDGLRKAAIFFDKKGKLVYVGLEFDFGIERFNNLYESLKKKYTVKSEKFSYPPFVAFTAGNSEIRLSQPHAASSKMNLAYGLTSLWYQGDSQLQQKQKAEEEAKKKDQEAKKKAVDSL